MPHGEIVSPADETVRASPGCVKRAPCFAGIRPARLCARFRVCRAAPAPSGTKVASKIPPMLGRYSSHLRPPSIGGLFVYTSSNDGSDHHEGLTFAKFNSMLPPGGKKRVTRWKRQSRPLWWGQLCWLEQLLRSPVSHGYRGVSSSPKRLQKL